jgi:hypothetical protein
LGSEALLLLLLQRLELLLLLEQHLLLLNQQLLLSGRRGLRGELGLLMRLRFQVDGLLLAERVGRKLRVQRRRRGGWRGRLRGRGGCVRGRGGEGVPLRHQLRLLLLRSSTDQGLLLRQLGLLLLKEGCSR